MHPHVRPTVSPAPRHLVFAAALLPCLLLASLAGAQPVVNPRVVEFDPSADHAAVLDGGQPVVTEYALELYLQGAAAPFYTMSLGKPTPQGDGKIRYDFSTNIAAWPLPGGTYESRVTAVGPTGTGRSDASNTFQFSAPCTYSLSSTAATVGVGSGSSSFSITAGTGCTWTVSKTATWITLITSSGTGSGTVSFSYAANTGTSRSGTITAGGQTFTLTQTGCSYTLSPGTFALTAGASAAQTVTVTAPAGCAWQASTSAPWITLGTPNSGTGNGSTTFSVQANPNGVVRAGTVIVAGQSVAVSQAAASCTASVTPTTLTVGSQATTRSVAITVASGCPWTAASGATWAGVSPASGTGPASVTVSVPAHAAATARSTSLTVAGVTISLTQDAFPAPVAPKNLRVIPSSE